MNKRISFLVLSAILVGIVAAGCSSSDPTPPPEPTARFRVVHASPDLGAVDIYLDASLTAWLEDVAYGDATTYNSGTTRTVTLVFRAAGSEPTSVPLYASEPIVLNAGDSVTALVAGLIAVNEADMFRLMVYRDNFQNTPQATARTVHAGSDAPNVRVTLGATDQVLADDLARWEDSGRGGVVYETGVEHDVVVTAAGGITSFRAPELAPAASYYFILTGLITGQGAQTTPFHLLIVGPGGVEELEPLAPRDFRLVHAVPDGGPVDAYMVEGLGDGMTRVDMDINMAFGDASAYGRASIRQVIIEFYDLSANPDQVDPLFTQSVHIHDTAGATTAFAAGLADSDDPADMVRVFSLPDDFPVPEAGMTAARLVHAVPNLGSLRVDFGDDGSLEATLDRFGGNAEGAISLTADTGLTMVVREGSGIAGLFTTPAMAADRDHYLVLTGIANGVPDFSLLTLTQEGSLGFTMQDLIEGQ